MDNVYRQKLQERAEALAKSDYLEFTDCNLEQWDQNKSIWTELYKGLAALTLEWSANAIRSTTTRDCDPFLLRRGFIPPKTDNNEG